MQYGIVIWGSAKNYNKIIIQAFLDICLLNYRKQKLEAPALSRLNIYIQSMKQGHSFS